MKLQHKRARTTKRNEKDKWSECAGAGSAGQNASAPSKKSCGGSKTSKTSDPERQITVCAGSPQQPYASPFYQHAHFIPIVGMGKERRVLIGPW